MRILGDLDGTVAHFDRKYDLLREELFPHLTGIPHSSKQVSFNLWTDRTPEEQDAIRQIMNHPGFYRDLEVMEGAVEAFHEMEAEGHEVFFLSAPWVTNETCASDKYAWVEEMFGEGWSNKLILAKDKTVVSGDILFDDKEPIPHKERADWTQVYIDQPYNKSATGFRLYNWSDWKSVVSQVEDYRNTLKWQLFEDIGEIKYA
ncbi:5'-nucleotidase [Microbacterium phage Pumpernickel]|uniref:5'-nucleotidase n=1 Tax=Microbacterium phage Pumpernickel TaxID=2885983 RepID=A0AAE8Y8G3_9CAUD|nr:5'-nucleotidase [Microbacterium phage Pumpernickel]UDL15973.1 5'-nucleotidase [Microbacterium phage Pumpernickel]